MTNSPVRELRLVLTTEDYDEALAFYRDLLGLPKRPSVPSPGGRVAILDAGRATLEIADPTTAGAKVLAEPLATPFKSTNARLEGAAGLQLTLFRRGPASVG